LEEEVAVAAAVSGYERHLLRGRALGDLRNLDSFLDDVHGDSNGRVIESGLLTDDLEVDHLANEDGVGSFQAFRERLIDATAGAERSCRRKEVTLATNRMLNGRFMYPARLR
jgi:hypothetical protein